MRVHARAPGRLAAHAVALLFGLPAVAAACTCVSMPLCESMWTSGSSAPAFFEGTVESIDPIDAGTVRVRLRDVRAVHGATAREVITNAFGDSCGYTFTVGERYLIDGSVRADGAAATSSCSKTAPIENAAADLAYLASLSRPARGGRIFGEVFSQFPPGGMFDDDGRQPVRGLRVEIAGPVRRTATTDGDGRFTFDGLPPGRYTLQGGLARGVRRLDDRVPASIVLPTDRACAEWRLFYERPRR